MEFRLRESNRFCKCWKPWLFWGGHVPPSIWTQKQERGKKMQISREKSRKDTDQESSWDLRGFHAWFQPKALNPCQAPCACSNFPFAFSFLLNLVPAGVCSLLQPQESLLSDVCLCVLCIFMYLQWSPGEQIHREQLRLCSWVCQKVTDAAAESDGLSFLPLAPPDCAYVWDSEHNRITYGEQQHSGVGTDFWHWKTETQGPRAEKLGKGTKGKQRGTEFSVEHKYAFKCQREAQRGWPVSS